MADTVSTPRIKGNCPMGCGETLFVGSGGFITCAYLECPCADAVSKILDERETEHLVTFDDDGFTIKHPLREWLDDALLSCDLHHFCNALPGPPVQPGTYRARHTDGTWRFEATR